MSDDEPRNPASDTLRRNWALMSDRSFLDDSPERLDTGFVHEDRRNIVAPVPISAEHVVESVHVYDEMSGGHPVFSIDEVVAVRGDRLVLARTRIDFPERGHAIVAGSLNARRYQVADRVPSDRRRTRQQAAAAIYRWRHYAHLAGDARLPAQHLFVEFAPLP